MRKGTNHALWIIFAACGVLGLGLYTLRLEPAAEGALFVAFSGAATAAIFAGIVLNRPQPLSGWMVMGAGQFFNLLGDFAYTRSAYLQDAAVPATLYETFYLVAQAFFLVGLAKVFYQHRRLVTGNAVAQGAMVAIGLSTLVWLQMVSPNLGEGFNWVEWARVLVYPACLLIIFTVAATFLMTGMGKSWSYRLFFAGIIFYTIGLSFYLQITTDARPIFELGLTNLPYTVDAAYSIAYLLIGAAYLHPSMRTFHDRVSEKQGTISRMELLLLAAAFWIGPFAYAFSSNRSVQRDVIIMLASMLVIFTLNEWRLGRLVRVLEEQNKELSQHREMLHHQAFHDALTGLPNRAFLHNSLEELIDSTRLGSARGAVFLIDVNNFKQVNDTLGHDAGDQVLKEVSAAFLQLKRKEDVVGRWGGDEFMMVLRNIPDESSAKALAYRLQKEIRWKVSGSEGSVAMSISIGICLIPTGTEKLQTIVKKADIALYQAKRAPEIGIAFSAW